MPRFVMIITTLQGCWEWVTEVGGTVFAGMDEVEPATPRGQEVKTKTLVCPGAPSKQRCRPVQLGENAPIRRLNFGKSTESDPQAKQVPGD